MVAGASRKRERPARPETRSPGENEHVLTSSHLTRPSRIMIQTALPIKSGPGLCEGWLVAMVNEREASVEQELPPDLDPLHAVIGNDVGSGISLG